MCTSWPGNGRKSKNSCHEVHKAIQNMYFVAIVQYGGAVAVCPVCPARYQISLSWSSAPDAARASSNFAFIVGFL